MTSSFILSVGGGLPPLRTLAKDVTNNTDSAYAKNNELFLCISLNSLCSIVLACIRQSYGISVHDCCINPYSGCKNPVQL